MQRGFHIRDALVLPDKLKELPAVNVAEILKIREEFDALSYVDFRTEMGPDQIRRLTTRQKDNLDKSRNEAFRLESRVRELLRTPEEVKEIEDKQRKAGKKAELDSLLSRKRQIEDFLQRQLKSKRENATKKEYRALIKEIEDFNQLQQTKGNHAKSSL